MEEDLRRPLTDSGPGTLDAFLGLAVYSRFGTRILGAEIEELEGLVRRNLPSLAPNAGMDPGLLLWATHFFPGSPWATVVRERSLTALDARWVDPPGYFRRNLPEPWSRQGLPSPLAISNFMASIGLRAQGIWSDRVTRVHGHFLGNPPAKEQMDDPLTVILALLSLHPGVMLAE
jgi:hypothetical protein